MQKSSIRTTIEDIVNYWFSRVDECGLSVDASEAHERCWRCGCRTKLERCHIIPASSGGKDEPSNLVLLCKRCHIDNPNVTDPEIMWDWLRAYSVPFYDTFWDLLGLKEYEFIYHKSFFSELEDLGINNTDEINNLLKEFAPIIIKEVKHHYGHPYINTATIAGAYRMILKEIARKYNKIITPLDYSVPRRQWYFGNEK